MTNDDKIKKGLELIGKRLSKSLGVQFTVSDDMLVLSNGQKEVSFKGAITHQSVETNFSLVSEELPGLSAVSADVYFEEEEVEFDEDPSVELRHVFNS